MSRGSHYDGRRRSGQRDELAFCTLDATGPRETLPRPVELASTESLYAEPADRSAGGNGNADRAEALKNCSRRFLWTTLESVILRPTELATSLQLPFGAICAPFADGNDEQTSVPLADPGQDGPLRCTRCRCYANPHFQWSNKYQGRVHCNMCGHHTEVPETFLQEMEVQQDDEAHPEFVHGSVDFLAPRDLDVDRSQVASMPSTCFLLETSPSARQGGVLHSALLAIERLLGDETSLPPMRRRMCIATYDEAVHFYAITRTFGFRMVTMTSLDDPFVPLGPEALFIDVGTVEGRHLMRILLEKLQALLLTEPTIFREPGQEEQARPGGSAGGPALRAAIEAVAQTGGDVVVLHTRLPTLGIGALRPPSASGEDSPKKQPTAPSDSPKRSSSSRSVHSPSKQPSRVLGTSGSPSVQQEAFYADALAVCIRDSVAVSAITAVVPGTEDELDLQALHWLPWRTGGDVLHYPCFDPASDSEHLARSLHHWAASMQGSSYACVFKMRCSKGLHCESLMAPWTASNPDGSAFELPRMSADNTFALCLKPEIEPDQDDILSHREDRKKQLYIQVAVLHTNSEGERLLRVHTLLVGVVFTAKMVFGAVAIFPLVAFALKQAAARALEKKPQKGSQAPRKPGEHVVRMCLQILVTYRRRCFSSEVGVHNLVISRTLALLPLYALAAQKLFYFYANAGGDSMGGEHFFRQVLRMPIHTILAALYPRVYALQVPGPSEGLPQSRDANSHGEGPTPCLLTPPVASVSEHVLRGSAPAYVINNGMGVWLCRSLAGTAAVAAVAAVTAATGEVPELSEEQAVWWAAEQARRELQVDMGPSPCYMALREVPATAREGEENWQMQSLRAALFVEDPGTEMSYRDWVEFLRQHVNASLQNG